MLAAIIALLAAFWAARAVNPSELDKRFESIEAFLRRAGPPLAAVVSALVVWVVWGSSTPVPTAPEESSYLLQADIFARLHWTAPAPALPEFFEQPHVLVSPVIASKFPPGHALLLAIGSVVHFHPLVPLLLTAATAALLFALATRLCNPWVGLLTWITWLTTPLVLRYQPGYFSEVTSATAILAAWWCLLDWREHRQKRSIALMALAVGWGAITRPVAMLAFGLPIVIVVVYDAVRYRLWLDVPLALAVALAVLAILPLWNARTTGDRTLTPLAVYTRDYLPFDKPGFRTDSTPPRRALPPVLKSMYDELLALRAAQRLNTLHRTVASRLWYLARDLWRATQLLLLPFFIVGLVVMTREMRFAGLSCILLFVIYLAYAHDPSWTLFYLEAAPVVAVITACGLWRALVWFTHGVEVRLHVDRRPKLGALLVAIVLTFFAVPTLTVWRVDHRDTAEVRTAFDSAVRQLPASKAIIFLHYAARPTHLQLVSNYPELQQAPVWVVHDLGERDRELIKLALDRTAFLFDEEKMEFRRF